MSAAAGSLAVTGPPAVRAAAGQRGWIRTVRYYLPAVVVFVGAIVAWELLVGRSQPPGLHLPEAVGDPRRAPGELGRGSLRRSLPSALATLHRGARRAGDRDGGRASLVAFATARWVSARAALLPLAVAANAVPIIAFAPLMNNWFGVLSPLSKMMMAAILVFFPVMANVTRGLVQVEPAALELMRSYAASDWTVLRKVRIPNALPYFFTALKLAADAEPDRGHRRRVLRRCVARPRPDHRPERQRPAVRHHLGGDPARRERPGSCSTSSIVVVERAVIPWHGSMRGQSIR